MKSVSQENNVRNVCGISFPADWTDFQCHRYLFLKAPQFQIPGAKLRVEGQEVVYTGQGRLEHAKVISKILWPKTFEWHEWSEQIVGRACDSPWLAISGPGASSKSTSIGIYALIWWMAAPLDSAVIMASKTIESSKKRIWREVARYYLAFSQKLGGYKDAAIGSSPRPSICPITGTDRKKDEAHGLFVTALHGKELEKEVQYLKGFHPKRILVVADELDSLEDGGQALIETFTDNLRTGTVEAQFIGLGNDPSLFNALGDMMAPEPGKPVTLENKEWTSAKNVTCLRLDAWDSPNIKHRDKFTGLVRQRDIDDLVLRKGENSPSVWIQLHGLHPPEGCSNTVLSEAALIRFHCFEPVTWKSEFTTSAALDPAFGGDSCIFRTFKRGFDTQNRMKILCDEIITIPIDASPGSDPADYQIAAKVRELCVSRRIPPDEFIIDSTGIGRGVAAILQREWSPRIEQCNFGGSPSERILSDEYPVPANKEYDRFVTELWFSCRQFVEADLIRGLDRPTSVQLCSRTYEDKGIGGNRKLAIQKKEEMLHSPDEADAFACAIELFRRKGVNTTIKTDVKKKIGESFEKEVEKWDFDSSTETYSDPLLDRFEETYSF
jgi:hypothetical protein